METPNDHNFVEDPDYVPISVKVIVAWLYLYALVNFFGALSLREGRIHIDLLSAVCGLLAIWSAYNLGYKRNYARVGAMIVAGWWFVTVILFVWQIVKNWQKIIAYQSEFSIRVFGQQLTNIPAIVFFALITGMNIFTIVTLLQPRIRDLFSKDKSVAVQPDSDDVVSG